MSYLLLKPYDNFFFRDGKPFDAGTSQWISGMNMPFPSTIYGAIFTYMIRENVKLENEINALKVEIKNQRNHIGISDSELNRKLESYLKIKNIYIYNKSENEVYIPAPLDIFINKEGKLKYGEFINEEYPYSTNVGNELKLEYLMKNPKDYDRADNYYISVLDFKNYYAEGIEEDSLLIEEDEIFLNPYKVGIKLNNDRTSDEGHLYRIDTSVFKDKDFRFLIEYDIEDKDIKLKSGSIKLGGEGKIAELKIIDKEPYSVEKLKEYYEEYQLDNNYVKLILTTEGIFKDTAFFPSLDNIEIVGVVNDKPLNIGGFDMLKDRAKPMLKANKRGCVYILNVQNGKGKKLKNIKEEIEKTLNINSENTFRGFNRFILSPFRGLKDE